MKVATHQDRPISLAINTPHSSHSHLKLGVTPPQEFARLSSPHGLAVAQPPQAPFPSVVLILSL